jgi:hypothetical protein
MLQNTSLILMGAFAGGFSFFFHLGLAFLPRFLPKNRVDEDYYGSNRVIMARIDYYLSTLVAHSQCPSSIGSFICGKENGTNVCLSHLQSE